MIDVAVILANSSPIGKYDDLTSTSLSASGFGMTTTKPPIDPATKEVDAAVRELPTQELDGRCKSATRLSPEERRMRQDAVRFANASMSLEGFTVSAEGHLRAERFIAGDMDLAEFVRGSHTRDE